MRNFTNKEAADPAAKKLSETAPPPAADAPKTTCIFTDPFFAYGCSLQGESHKGTNTPCQDFQDAITAENGGTLYLICGIADGVGSCELSHYGAATAVQQALRTCADGIAAFAAPPTDEECLALLKAAFAVAQDAVEARADEMDQLTFDFCSTLTVCIYNGQKLHIGHIGDDGVVALFSDRTMKLVTTRHKGEESNAVRPLQFGEKHWQFLTVDQPVDGFIMSTDGVLDSFVKMPPYEDIIFAPFANARLFQTIESNHDLQEHLENAIFTLNSEAYRSIVSDDITLLAVGSRRALSGKKPPAFDTAAFEARLDAIRKYSDEHLAELEKQQGAKVSPPPAAGEPLQPAEPAPAASEPPQPAEPAELPQAQKAAPDVPSDMPPKAAPAPSASCSGQPEQAPSAPHSCPASLKKSARRSLLSVWIRCLAALQHPNKAQKKVHRRKKG